MTSPDVTRTSVACEVKLYLAVPSPSSSRLALPGLFACRRSRDGPVLGSAVPRLEVPIRVQELLEDLHDHGSQLDRVACRLPVVGRARRERSVKLAGDASLERCRGVSVDRLELMGTPRRRTAPGTRGPGSP